MPTPIFAALGQLDPRVPEGRDLFGGDPRRVPGIPRRILEAHPEMHATSGNTGFMHLTVLRRIPGSGREWPA